MQLGDKKLLVQRASVGSKNATLVSVHDLRHITAATFQAAKSEGLITRLGHCLLNTCCEEQLLTEAFFFCCFSLFLLVPPDQYKPDPSHAAGPRPEQLCDPDGRPAHRGPVSNEHGGPGGAAGWRGVRGDCGGRQGRVQQVRPGQEHRDPPTCGRPGGARHWQGGKAVKPLTPRVSFHLMHQRSLLGMQIID